MWSGTAIPTGWALCDGTNGRPDLRDRFIVGASATKAVNSVGGSASHNHTGSTGPADGKIWIDDNSGGTDYWSVRDSHTHTVTTNAASSLPPYYALAFIIKTAP
ncbi:MAG: tail fiber protein [Planctomycetes bacterium]|nr:tail fiber protein [Planctomycetota bacterium]